MGCGSVSENVRLCGGTTYYTVELIINGFKRKVDCSRRGRVTYADLVRAAGNEGSAPQIAYVVDGYPVIYSGVDPIKVEDGMRFAVQSV